MTDTSTPTLVSSGPERNEAGLIYRYQMPRGSGPYPTAVLLHGRLGDEDVMWVFRRAVPASWLIVAPRAPLPDESLYSWLIQPADKWPDLAAFDPAVDALARFLRVLPRLYNADPDRMFLMGFSQGAAVSYATALRQPDLVSGIAGLVGFAPNAASEEIDGRLNGLPVFMASGTEDPTVPTSVSQASADLLRLAGADLQYREYPSGHKLPAAGIQDLRDWFSALKIAFFQTRQIWDNARMVESQVGFSKEWSDRINRGLVGSDEARIGVRLRLPFVWLGGLLAVALLLPDRIWTTLLVGLLGLMGVAFFWTRSLARGLSATRRLRYGWVSVGDRLEEEFSLTNRAGMPALWVEIQDESNVPGYQAGAVRTVGASDRIRWRQSSVCHRRGLYQLGPWKLRSGDPFGIFEVTRRYEAAQGIIIHPPVHSSLPIPLPPGQSEGRMKTRERSPQATINAATVRDYHVNDPFHWIHWRTTARRDALYVRQFERDAAGDIWLVVDCQAMAQLGVGIDGTEEHAVLLAAALAGRALGEMRPVGLATYGQVPQIIPPGVGEGQQWRILRALALLQADGEIDLERALREFSDSARRGSAAIIITPSGDSNWLPQLAQLARRGIRSHVLLLDRPSFGGETNSEALRRAITLLGFHCGIVHRGEVGHPLVEEERHGFWEFKVTATGKAVAVRRPEET